MRCGRWERKIQRDRERYIEREGEVERVRGSERDTDIHTDRHT